MSARSMELFDTWETYRKVVAGDYMSHGALAAATERALAARFSGRPYTLIDLGCGDAAPFVPLLKAVPPAHYTGVDLSNTALALAAKNLQGPPFDVTLTNADMLDALAGEGCYDVIHSSFAVHHLTRAQKAEFFRRAAQRLAPGGLLLLADVVREEDETLPVYLDRYAAMVRTWEGLSPGEREYICDHLLTYDQPEIFSVLEAQARAAGLVVEPGGARCNWHRLLCFSHG